MKIGGGDGVFRFAPRPGILELSQDEDPGTGGVSDVDGAGVAADTEGAAAHEGGHGEQAEAGGYREAVVEDLAQARSFGRAATEDHGASAQAPSMGNLKVMGERPILADGTGEGLEEEDRRAGRDLEGIQEPVGIGQGVVRERQ